MSPSPIYLAYLSAFNAVHAVRPAPEMSAASVEEQTAAAFGAADAHARKAPASPKQIEARVAEHLGS